MTQLLTPEPCLSSWREGKADLSNGSSHKGRAKQPSTQGHRQNTQAGEWSEVIHPAWLGFFLVTLSALFSIHSGLDISRSHSTAWYLVVPGTASLEIYYKAA